MNVIWRPTYATNTVSFCLSSHNSTLTVWCFNLIWHSNSSSKMTIVNWSFETGPHIISLCPYSLWCDCSSEIKLLENVIDKMIWFIEDLLQLVRCFLVTDICICDLVVMCAGNCLHLLLPAPRYYLYQWWAGVSWTSVNKRKWNLSREENIFSFSGNKCIWICRL